MDSNKINELIEQAIEAVLKAGKEIIEVYNTDDFQVKIKSDDSPLTIADQRGHNAIVAILEKTNIPIMSEEGTVIPYSERKNWEYYWCVDPLDGTKEFIKRNGEFTVNIALIHKTKPVAGVIYVPVTKELYVGEINLGAIKISDIDISNFTSDKLNSYYEKGDKLPYSGLKDKFTAVGSRSHMSEETEEYISTFKEKYGDIEIISKGSSLKLCMVAEGKADVYPRFAPTMEWDTAAGHAIAVSAGFLVTKKDGVKPLEYNKEDLLNPWFIVKSKGL